VFTYKIPGNSESHVRKKQRFLGDKDCVSHQNDRKRTALDEQNSIFLRQLLKTCQHLLTNIKLSPKTDNITARF